MADDKAAAAKQQPNYADLQRQIEELRTKLAAAEASKTSIAEAMATDVDLDAQHKAWLMLSSQEKSQLAADKRYGDLRNQPGVSVWEVSIPAAKEHPRLRIPARSEVEAVGFYNQTCGIRFSEHPHDVRKAV